MKNSTEREKILKRLRGFTTTNGEQISINETNEKIFTPSSEDPLIVFAEKISSLGGRFVYCQDEKELFDNLTNLASYRKWSHYNAYSEQLQKYLQQGGLTATLADSSVEVGISLCQGIVSNTGSIIITSTQGAGRTLLHFPPILIVVALSTQICQSYKQILNLLPQTPPEWVMSIKAGKLIEEEIKEFYIFVVDE